MTIPCPFALVVTITIFNVHSCPFSWQGIIRSILLFPVIDGAQSQSVVSITHQTHKVLIFADMLTKIHKSCHRVSYNTETRTSLAFIIQTYTILNIYKIAYNLHVK